MHMGMTGISPLVPFYNPFQYHRQPSGMEEEGIGIGNPIPPG
jgi:hypothetical protein